jgi:hypothetical protein
VSNIFKELAAPFPKEKIHWRAQSITKDGSKAMALAYLDARDVMDRLDAVCGPDGWQAEHYDCGGGKMACKIGIRSQLVCVNSDNAVTLGDWIWKSDGAGETQIEAEKGAFSGALKRAGVMWGIGRYLYSMPAPWVPCETYERGGKKVWKKWTADPWQFCGAIPGGVHPGDESGADTFAGITDLKVRARGMSADLSAVTEESELTGFLVGYAGLMNELSKNLPDWHKAALDAVEGKRESFKQAANVGAG